MAGTAWPDRANRGEDSGGARPLSPSGKSRDLRLASEGQFKGSDIDLTLFGDGLTDAVMSRIYWALDDLLLPYKIDLSVFSGLKHPALIDHIRRAGIVLFTREPAAAPAAANH